MAAPTLAQALAASEAVDNINAQILLMTSRLAQITTTGAQLATLNLANAIAQNNAQNATVTALITDRQTALATETAVIVAYNTANPGSPIPIG